LTLVKRAKAIGCRGASEYKGADGHKHRFKLPVPDQPGTCRVVDKEPKRRERAGPPSGGPDHSIRKNNVLPGSGPTDLHYGNGHVLQLRKW
jgi:hypothetical protein